MQHFQIMHAFIFTCSLITHFEFPRLKVKKCKSMKFILNHRHFPYPHVLVCWKMSQTIYVDTSEVDKYPKPKCTGFYETPCTKIRLKGRTDCCRDPDIYDLINASTNLHDPRTTTFVKKSKAGSNISGQCTQFQCRTFYNLFTINVFSDVLPSLTTIQSYSH